MSTSIAQNIEALCQEQGIDRDLVIEAIKEAVRAAAKKQFKGGEDIQVDWSPETGLELAASKVVVEEVNDPSTELAIDEAKELGGDEVEVGDALLLPMPMEELGRIAAQTAKQILFQKVRDAVRSNVYEQYIDRVGELVNGFVGASDHSRTARRKDRHHRVVRRAFCLRGELIVAGESQSSSHHGHRESPDGSDRQRRSAQPGYRQTWPECPLGNEACRLEHR